MNETLVLSRIICTLRDMISTEQFFFNVVRGKTWASRVWCTEPQPGTGEDMLLYALKCNFSCHILQFQSK